jgi:hypothetical protein
MVHTRRRAKRISDVCNRRLPIADSTPFREEAAAAPVVASSVGSAVVLVAAYFSAEFLIPRRSAELLSTFLTGTLPYTPCRIAAPLGAVFLVGSMQSVGTTTVGT